MLDPEPFYHNTTQKVLTAFASIFDNIHVATFRDGKIKNSKRVPVVYGPAQKWLRRNEEREDLEEMRTALKMPRISYEISSIAEDASRRLSRNNLHRLSDDESIASIQYMAVPYTMDVTMTVLSKTRDEGYQIVEQILPYFAPDLTLSVKGLYGSGHRSNLPITLTSIDPSDEYEGTGEDRDVLQWTLSFTIKFNYAGRVIKRALIKSVDVNLESDIEGDKITARVVGLNDTELDFITEISIEEIDKS